jgi:hypothetical protein
MIRTYFTSFIIFLFLAIIFSPAYGQKKGRLSPDSIRGLAAEYENSIYLGVVSGKNANTYNSGRNLGYDTIFKLVPLTKSENKIEIRFYTFNSWSDNSYCTILSYDTAFKITRIKHTYYIDSIKQTIDYNKPSNTILSVKTNPDSLFKKLVENGIFSLTQFNQKDYSNYKAKVLTKNGIKDGLYIRGVLDGVDFQLEFKVDTIFNSIYMNNPHLYFEANPDYELIRRYKEISELLLSGFE